MSLYRLSFMYSLLKNFGVGLFGAILFIPLTLSAQSYIENDQRDYYKENGEYKQEFLQNNFAINVYESLCKGYQTEVHLPDRIEYVGYGPLADQFTYTINFPVVSTASTSVGRF